MTAWRAVCALLDHAEEFGLESSPWSTSARDEAERVRSELERALLSARGEVEPAPYNSALAATMVGGITTSLDEGELAFVVARVLDDHHWASFTHDWLEERGHTFALSEGERYPVGVQDRAPERHRVPPRHDDLPSVNVPESHLPDREKPGADQTRGGSNRLC